MLNLPSSGINKKDDDLYRRKWGKGHVLGTQSCVCLKKQ